MSWVNRQHRAMARWVGSKVDAAVEDLTTDLNDGLVLVKLVNVIAEESGSSEYLLTPIYEKPTIHLQKVENIDDVLKFCRLILNINTCSVSAQNVVEGDLKLILGLIWTLFVYATSTSISVANEGNSIHEIKSILLRWVNQIARSRALPELSNFTKDWSLQAGSRPDLTFGAICDYFLPNALFKYHDLNSGKPLANLDMILLEAEDKLQIPQLMVSEDFNVLVPDEKCIILYLLQWYTFFELTPDVPDSPAIPQEEIKPDNCMSQFMLLCLEASQAKHSYEAKALRLVDQVNTNIMKLSNINEELCSTIVPADLVDSLNGFCSDIKSSNITEQLSSRTQFPQISMFTQFLVDLLRAYEHFTVQLKPTFMHHDFPESQALLKSIAVSLSQTGIPSYQPEKNVALSTIATRLECLNELDNIVSEKVVEILQSLHSSKLANADGLIATLETHLRAHNREPIPPALKKYVDELSQIMDLKQHLDRFHSVLLPKHNAQSLRILVDSLETIDVPITPDTPTSEQTMAFEKFKNIVSQQNNQRNLTHADLTRFVEALAGESISKKDKKAFLLLVPSRRMLNRSESDEFSMYGSDENTSVNEIEESALFDKVQQTMEEKLAGTYNKLYNLAEFVEGLEGGFAI
ncbi:hypothetical protein FT663_02966 [Candidozyma haemuli var. vulneris]|uniref:Calponin-homology (CH) domain-containing protein n=1 Tax=Candidozyma haemuli TaxID=45357 RepID=A0A2V1AN02_9ASCO|nr:hypothetical protein CXQ85_001539 [[Candida] haemuloni]KAF3990893.1 hypothetical protein FT663_02966 [[Candida] haemuloni var. vulneris]KAF3992767.1 hypothetical protein FT662_00976 [[Candida] haemuloni var. vulneris]PVH19238.1 hypothetical protein CXQ85_001539 [[Candida] haemuloni]